MRHELLHVIRLWMIYDGLMSRKEMNQMANREPAFRNVIIGGTIKSATSSVFNYLCAHPEVCGSSVKETLFFTHQYTGNIDHDLKRYMKFFSPKNGAKNMVEASPNYLAYKENVAPRIQALLPDVKLLFILRNPVDRLLSYYNFALGKLELPRGLAFEDYVHLCEQYSSAELTPKISGIAEKHLRALEIGKYSKYLRNYFNVFAVDQIKVLFYDDLKNDPVRFMADICCFIGVNPDFYQSYVFNKANVTFTARRKLFHRVAMLMNQVLESTLRQRPALKMHLVRLYKRLNQNHEGYMAMESSTRTGLLEYYSKYNKDLGMLLSGQELPEWAR